MVEANARRVNALVGFYEVQTHLTIELSCCLVELYTFVFFVVLVTPVALTPLIT